MSLLIVPDSLRAKLAAAEGRIEMCAADGTMLGVFTPHTEKKKYDLEPKITYEEMARRVAESDGKGRKLKDIMSDLEARG